jgi:histidinol phosphatase-like PHP family hydrolase
MNRQALKPVCWGFGLAGGGAADSMRAMNAFTRREFLGGLALAGAVRIGRGADTAPAEAAAWPREDLHVHLDNSTIAQVAELSAKLGVKFGIVEHAGTKENKYPVVLSNDEELRKYLAMLASFPVYRGVQVEFIDWLGGFSRAALKELDFILGDAMTIRGADGDRVKMWEKEFTPGDPQKYMDRYVDWHREVLEAAPLDILANTTWLPESLMPQYDALWTAARMKKVIDAAVARGTALEISSKYEIPRKPFLELARKAGAKFTFGSNGRYPNMGKLDYSFKMAAELGLKAMEIFRPGVGPKAVERWKGGA